MRTDRRDPAANAAAMIEARVGIGVSDSVAAESGTLPRLADPDRLISVVRDEQGGEGISPGRRAIAAAVESSRLWSAMRRPAAG